MGHGNLKTTTRACPTCGNTYLALLPSLNKKYCVVCEKDIDWYLDEGQSSIYSNRMLKAAQGLKDLGEDATD